MELLGRARRGYFVEGLSGEQYAYPEAVEALHEAKLRVPEDGSDSDDLALINLFDPANPFGSLFPITTAAGEPVKVMRTPTKYLILQGGRPIVLYTNRVTLLADISRETAEAAMRLLTDVIDDPAVVDSRREIHVRQWNYHPIDVSPARHLLTKLGFVQVSNRWKGCVYNGVDRPDAAMVTAADDQIPERFEHAGKEAAPVVYDAAWVISRASETIQPKLRELIAWLEDWLPSGCEFVYRPRYFKDFQVLYRGMRCVNPHVQQKKINLHITHKGWVPPIMVTPDTDLTEPAFSGKVVAQFERSRKAIDALLEAGRRGEDQG
jgi:hypothetical protein